MNHRRSFPYPAALLLVVWMAPAYTNEPIDATPESQSSAVLAASCYGCHRLQPELRATQALVAKQHNAKPIPTLNGLREQELATALLGFYDGSRPATVMNRIVRGYTLLQLKALAGHLASPEPQP